jgi:hypothetical protein
LKNGALSRYLVGLGKRIISLSVMKPFISTFGRIRYLVATYSSIYVEKDRFINHVVRINKLAEALLKTISVLMSANRLLMIRVE